MRLQAVSAVNDDVVWVSGVAATFVRTVDGGRTWDATVVPGPADLQFRDVHAVSADTAFLLSSGNGDASRIYRTVDAGESWTLQFVNADEEAFFDCFDFWDARNGLAYSDAFNGELVVIRTTDGETWQRIPPSGLPAARGSEGGFAASGTCLVVGAGRRAWIGTGAGDTARVIRTTDAGDSWTAVEVPIVSGSGTSGIFSLTFFDQRSGLALGGDLADTTGFSQNVIATGDGGRTWTVVGQPTFAGVVYGSAAVPGAPSPTVVAVGPNGISYSVDGGMTWLSLDSSSHWAVAFASVDAGWAVGPEGRIMKIEWRSRMPQGSPGEA